MAKVIPVYVIAGFLGSGKTTLLTRSLEAYNMQGKRPVVIMNELGDVNLDGTLVEAAGGDVPMAELLSGCICCTIRSDLSLQLHELVGEYAPDAVFIEATGVANPIEIMDAVTEASLYLPISLDSVVTVMDGAFVSSLGAKALDKTGRLLRDQVRCASHVLLNKMDRLSAEEADAAEALLRKWNAHAPIIRTVRSEVELDRLFIPSKKFTGEKEHVCSSGCDHTHETAGDAHHHHSHEHVSVFTHFFSAPIDSHEFEAFMKSLPESVYRAKGIVTFTDTASRFLFQYAYRELDFTRIRPQGHVNDVAVFIGEQFPKGELIAGLGVLEQGLVSEPESVRPYRDILKESYNRHAGERDTGLAQDWKVTERERYVQELRHAGASTLLEVGAGPGRDSLYFKEQGFRVTAVDLSEEMVQLCKEKELQAYQMDMAALSFPDESFDAVYALNCLLHIPKAELEGVLREIHRVLTPGGLLYMGVYGGVDSEGIWENDSYEPKRFFAMYEDAAMREAVEQVFEVVYFGTVNVSDSDRQPHFQSMILRKVRL